jgi:hypothetical protein
MPVKSRRPKHSRAPAAPRLGFRSWSGRPSPPRNWPRPFGTERTKSRERCANPALLGGFRVADALTAAWYGPRMTTSERAAFGRRRLDDLTIDDERSFRHVGLYADLKEVLRRDDYSFRILPETRAATWDRALFLNLTFWGASEGGDVLVDAHVPADVVAHIAWHRLAVHRLGDAPGGPPSVDALFLGEAIASAFDMYLVGRLLGHAPHSSFLATQVPAMAAAAGEMGVGNGDFELLLAGIAGDPEGAFAELRELLIDATSALFASEGADTALEALARFESHRFGSLIHHYALANWVLYARAYGDRAPAQGARAVERSLRLAEDPLEWLTDEWVRPALG